MGSARFFAEFLRRPLSTGAVLPSSAELGRLMTDWMDFDNIQTVVELGPGTGAFTTEILGRTRPGTKYVGIEVNPTLAAYLRTKMPGIAVYDCSATSVKSCLRHSGSRHADAIVSGLPWAVFSDEKQDEILAAACSALRPDGAFATFGYVHGMVLPAARRFRSKLQETFRSVETSRVAWRNAPPAFVYRCLK